MKTLPIAADILSAVTEKDVPFGLAVRNAFHNRVLEPSEKSAVSSLVGCALRHYMVFDDVITEYFGDITRHQKTGLLLLLSDVLFVHRFPTDELVNMAVDLLGDPRYGAEETAAFAEGVKNHPLISEKYEKNSPEFLSLRFNTPLWISKMWRKHYGPKKAYDIMKADSRPPRVYVETGRSVNRDELIASGDFSPVEGRDVLLYNGKNLNKSVYGENHEIIPCSMAVKEMMDGLDIDPLRGLAFYAATPNNFYLDAFLRCGPAFEADFIAGNPQTYFDVTRNVQKYGLRNLHVYEGKASSIITCISRPVNLFIVLPASTNFALLRSTPDYFLRADQKLMDSYIAEQKTALEEAALQVAPGGTLAYFVTTVSEKEGGQLIEEFLAGHPEFTLVKSHQAFPYEELDSSLFYAVMTRNGENE